MTQPLCIHVPALREPLEITLPGGIAMRHIELADLIQPALAPLVPIFNIVDCIAALYACAKAVVDALGPPPDPTKLAACVPELAEKVSKLLGLVPVLSLPLLIVGLIDLLIAVLSDVRAQLIHLQVEIEQATRIIERARELNDPNLEKIWGCVRESVGQEAANLGKQLASLGKLIGLINVFMGLIGGPEVPDFAALENQSLDKAIAPIDVMVSTLQSIRAQVPVP
jgi:hypothetical protein